MKGKSISFRPKKETRDRLDALATATERPITFFIEKAIGFALPELEKRYSEELSKFPPNHAAQKGTVDEGRLVAGLKKALGRTKSNAGDPQKS